LIAVGGLFYQAERFLDDYFSMLRAQEYPKRKMRLIWLYGEGEDATLKSLKQFGEEHGREYAEFTLFQVNRMPGDLTGEEGKRLAQQNVVQAYNHLLEFSKPDDLLIMEQDIVAPPDAVSKLIALSEKAAIVAGVTLVTGSQLKVEAKNGGIFKVCGLPAVSAYVFDAKHEYTSISTQLVRINAIRLPAELMDKAFFVDGVATGLSLIKREVMDRLIFETAPIRSQDLHYCARARELGYKIAVDAGIWYEHNHYKYRKEFTPAGLVLTLLDSVRNDGITFEIEPKNNSVGCRI